MSWDKKLTAVSKVIDREREPHEDLECWRERVLGGIEEVELQACALEREAKKLRRQLRTVYDMLRATV